MRPIVWTKLQVYRQISLNYLYDKSVNNPQDFLTFHQNIKFSSVYSIFTEIFQLNFHLNTKIVKCTYLKFANFLIELFPLKF